jgi:uncharacterized protein CbrC (UPF0167 family)
MEGDHDELGERGMPFRLFRAPVSTVYQVSYDGECGLCHRDAAVLFGLGLRDYIIRPCTSCHAPVGLRLGWPDEPPVPTECAKCGISNPWPSELARDTLPVCYDCIRDGRVAISHETRLGHVDFAHTLRGMLQFGREHQAKAEGLQTTVLETYDDGSHRVGVHLPVELLHEMHRTPCYSKLQREYWPYHCGGFMAFVGRWQQEDFERVSGGRGLEWFIKHGVDDLGEDEWEWLPGGLGWSYVHKCLKCGLHRIFVDSD